MKNNRFGSKGGWGDLPWMYGSRGDPPLNSEPRGDSPEMWVQSFRCLKGTAKDIAFQFGVIFLIRSIILCRLL